MFLVLRLSLLSSLNPGVKSRMKMRLEQHRQAMFQLHLSDQQCYCPLRRVLYYIMGVFILLQSAIVTCIRFPTLQVIPREWGNRLPTLFYWWRVTWKVAHCSPVFPGRNSRCSQVGWPQDCIDTCYVRMWKLPKKIKGKNLKMTKERNFLSNLP